MLVPSGAETCEATEGPGIEFVVRLLPSCTLQLETDVFANSESRIEHISQKIDDLARLMEGLSPGRSPQTPSSNRDQTYQMPMEKVSRPKPSASENQAMESSLLSQAVVATTFLEEAVRLSGEENTPETSKALKAALETLQAVVNSQKRRSSPEEEGLPFVAPLPPGTTTRDLPVPPIDKVMACLRMAQGAQHPSIRPLTILTDRS